MYDVHDGILERNSCPNHDKLLGAAHFSGRASGRLRGALRRSLHPGASHRAWCRCRCCCCTRQCAKNAIDLHIRDRDVLDVANLDASASVLAARNNLCRSLIKLLAPGKDPDPNMSQQNVQMAVSRRMAAKLRAIRAAFAKVRRKMSRADPRGAQPHQLLR